MKPAFPLWIRTMETLPGEFVQVVLDTPGNFPSWLPGQFLSVRRNIGKGVVIRSYSICSLPEEGLKILVKREVNGVFSRWLFDSAQPGDVLDSLAPAGRFTLPNSGQTWDSIVFFGAGSGISPIRPLVLQALERSVAKRAFLLYSGRTIQESPFFNELAELGVRKSSFTFSPFLSISPSGLPNRLTNMLLEKYLEANDIRPEHSSLLYICGPLAYRRMVRFTMRALGFAEGMIREEKFDISTPNQPSRPLIQKEAVVQVQTDGKGVVQFLCKPHETLLAAGLRQGIDLPYSCKGGVCSSCSAVLLEGKVHMTLNEILSPDDLAGGLILTCTALPASERITLQAGATLLPR